VKSFKSYLIEKRKNPDQNPKISTYKQLEPYKNDPDIYITFTSVDKVGINPHSNYSTPNGIYIYPLREIWTGFDHTKEHIVVPYVGESSLSPYTWVLRKSCSIFQEASKYTSSNYNTDMDKIRKLYDSKEILPKLTGMVDKGFSKNWTQVKKLIPDFYDIFKVRHEPTQGNVGKFDDHFDWDNDKIDLILNSHKENPEGSVLSDIVNDFFDNSDTQKKLLNDTLGGGIGMPKLRKRVFKMEVEKFMISKLQDLAEAGLSPIDILIENASNKAVDDSPFAKFWNVTRWIAYEGNPEGGGIAFGMDMAKYRQIKLPSFERRKEYTSRLDKFWHTTWTVSVNLTAQKWNNLLRKMGYCGFVDKLGKGIIHPNEPVQGVFLSKDAFKIEEKLRNINPRKIYKTIKDFRTSNYTIDELEEKGNMLVLGDNVPPSEAMAMIPIKSIKWSEQDIIDLARQFDQIARGKNPFMKEVFHNNLWKLPERTFRQFLNRMTQINQFKTPNVTASLLIKALQKNKSNPKSIKYVRDWIDS